MIVVDPLTPCIIEIEDEVALSEKSEAIELVVVVVTAGTTKTSTLRL